MLLVAPFLWLVGFGYFLSSRDVGFGLLTLSLVTVVAGIGLLIYGLAAERIKLTPKVRIAVGIVLVVAGVLVGLAFRLQGGFINLYGAAAAWVLTVGGLIVLHYRRWEAPIATGIAIVLVAPLVWFVSVLTPVTVFFVLSFVPAFAVATYGFAIIVLGRAEKQRQETG